MKVNRPIDFSYEGVDLGGKSTGIIEVRYRRAPSSSKSHAAGLPPTLSTSAEATQRPSRTQIANIGESRDQSRRQPLLEFWFGDLKTRTKIDGGEIRCETSCFDVPAYGNDEATFGLTLRAENEGFYADPAEYMRDVLHLKPPAIAVSNESRTTAQQVVVRITFTEPDLDVLTSCGTGKPVSDRSEKLTLPPPPCGKMSLGSFDIRAPLN